MVKQLRYYGYHFCNLIAADNRQLCQDRLIEKHWDKKIQQAVEFYKLVEPGKPYTRLNAHKIAVYKVKKPQWKSQGRFSIPYGELETMVEVDLGVEFMAAMTGTKEVVIKEKARHYFTDESFIEGAMMKLVPGECQLEGLEDFLEIRHDLENPKKKTNEFEYHFGIKKGIVDPTNLLEVHIESYTKIEDSLWFSEKKVALIAKYPPRGFFLKPPPPSLKLIYRKTSPNLIHSL